MERTNDRSANWHEDVFFGVHYDLHANANDTELGRELTYEHLKKRLERVRPDWIQCDCKGHPGYTSWPTRTGSTSPGVVEDAMRTHRDVTRDLDIRLGMHYSGVIDARAVELHPDWACVDAEGKAHDRSTCRLSAYADKLMIPQMLELIDTYDVDGFWVDGENWGSPPCWCERCRTEFTRRTGLGQIPAAAGQPHWEEWLAFHRGLFEEYVTTYADAVHARKPDCLICSNWMYTIRQPEPMCVPVDYLSGDYTPNWGAARAALEGRMLDCRGVTWDLMVWGFTRNYAVAGSPATMKPTVHLCQEVAEVVALGGAVMVYAKPERTGWLNSWEHDIIADTAAFCRARRDVCFGSETCSEAAVLHTASHYYSCNAPLYNYGAAVEPLEGALNALLETHRSTDILTEEAALDRLTGYKLLVVPEQTRLTGAVQDALSDFARNGGCVLMSGSNLCRDVPELVGATPRGDCLDRPVGLPVGQEAVLLGGSWQPVLPAERVEDWLHRHAGLEPEKDRTDETLVTCRRVGSGAIAAVHGPLFRNYFQSHFPRTRQLIGDLVDRLGVHWDVTLTAPPRLEVVLRRKNGTLMVNLINRGAAETLSPNRMIVEELVPVENVSVHLSHSVVPTEVTLMPGNTPLRWDSTGDHVTVHVPRVDIHDVVVIASHE